MGPSQCQKCQAARALIIRPKNRQKLCKACFIDIFETEIHETILSTSLLHRGERVAIGASGGKDSTVLASVLKTLNERYDYGLQLSLLSIDEGIKGYRDDSLETVKRNARQYQMPLTIVGYAELYGWTMDQVVAEVGKKGNCTYCGVFRRQALDRGAGRLNIRHVVTGHNADDVAETVMMNLLRGDLPRLARGTSIVTDCGASDIKRSKPLKYAYEKEIVLYAHYKKLDYFSTECIYSPEAFRGSARSLIKDLEKIRPSSILDIVRSGEDMALLVPAAVTGTPRLAMAVENDDYAAGGCGSQGVHAAGSEIAAMETQLAQEDLSSHLEVEITLPSPIAQSKKATKQQRAASGRYKPGVMPKQVKTQTMGTCLRCGYMSSQKICKACTLIEGLNKSRPATNIQIDAEDEEISTTLARRLEATNFEMD